MPDWILPGEKNAIVQLKKLKKSLAGYDDGRNDPTKNHLSNLSPFFPLWPYCPTEGSVGNNKIKFTIER